MSKKSNACLWMLLLLLCVPHMANAALQLNRFTRDSYQKVLELYQGNAFVLVLWSLDCPPCIDELATLGRFHRSHPTAEIVLVSTDSYAQQPEISRLMQLHGLDDIQQWVFDGDAVQAIRFAIDPLWYGELPRSYFYRDDHQRQSRSGRLAEEVLLGWHQAADR